MNKPPKEKYVTQSLFKKEIKGIHRRCDSFDGRFDSLEGRFDSLEGRFGSLEGRFDTLEGRFNLLGKRIDSVESRLDKKIDSLGERLDQKIDNVAFAVIKMNERLENVENTMATKSDTNLILNRIDYLIKKGEVFDQEERVQSLHLNEVGLKVTDHEKRITVLETAHD